ncbi:nuclear transport factor 2 family protein [Rhizorhabdus dicambivorans]|uniref:Nuclear transport factor 2 family protein n=1 Tax=Rhizorhabdus dicambivorans TaxID=1850238 RepID=A0A2A4FTN9_9SPHN|nr:nuclear transport factor 2 family protein [Rhizorhabdus dicambivorans]ATE63941.1 nuclear transport factor 2 family protein [Rhizorhabdus dicambivorans]PCE41547.1 nuclear transport factor 2 family protein [Rhizorhabdus dicambivorans]
MDPIETLLAIEEVRAVKARYFRCVDTKDWEGFAALFAEDALFDISDDVPGTVIRGRAAIVEAASVPLARCRTVHHGHCPEVEIISPTEARAIWAMEDILRWDDDAPDMPLRRLHGFGHYHERYAKRDGRWLIMEMKLTRLFVDHEAR